MEVALRIVIDPHDWLPLTDALQPGEAFATIRAGVFARQRLQLTYRSRQAARVQELVVEPHGLMSVAATGIYAPAPRERRDSSRQSVSSTPRC